MRMFFSDLISYVQDGMNDTSSSLKTFARKRINSRYELVTDKLNTWTQVVTRTATSGTSAGASKQYYALPPNLREIESIVVTVGSFDYPLRPVYSQEEWDLLNAEPRAEAAYPERYFRRRDDYGLFPYDFEDDGTITINYTQRAVPLYFENYTTGTVTATENDQTITVAGGANLTTGSVKAGFWFCLTDSNGEPRGTFYRIGSVTDTTNAELETYFEESTEAGATYIIGQSPEIPEEGHELLGVGAIADFYSIKQKDLETSTRFNNIFWTGNPNLSYGQANKSDDQMGGLIGLIHSYKDRDSSIVVDRLPVYRDLMEFRAPSSVTT